MGNGEFKGSRHGGRLYRISCFVPREELPLFYRFLGEGELSGLGLATPFGLRPHTQGSRFRVE